MVFNKKSRIIHISPQTTMTHEILLLPRTLRVFHLNRDLRTWMKPRYANNGVTYRISGCKQDLEEFACDIRGLPGWRRAQLCCCIQSCFIYEWSQKYKLAQCFKEGECGGESGENCSSQDMLCLERKGGKEGARTGVILSEFPGQPTHNAKTLHTNIQQFRSFL